MKNHFSICFFVLNLIQCEYLLADREQRETIAEANSDTGLDPNSNIVRSILENPVVQRTLNNPKTFFGKIFQMFFKEKRKKFLLKNFSDAENFSQSKIVDKLFK